MKFLISITLLLSSHFSFAYDYFCQGWDNPVPQSANKSYYSNFFSADEQFAYADFQDAFASFVLQKYGDSIYTTVRCGNGLYWREDDMQNSIQSDKSTYNLKIIQTHWQPEPFERQALRDFHINVPSNNREVQLCVRDYECEDGDEIEVSVNSSAVFRGEIENSWDCNTVDVNKGRNSIKLYAINGTGHKGNCPNNINTGEIRIKGNNTQSQQWQHRGGKGSSANIIVDIE
ncbi:hypothetical protein SPBRAN_1494 [uncultured Candidatus Thioglobus sp.]|nr:hypothetical protein SPBRAN_1494 [uncultured Candidatus Thioglobus sp.]